MILYNKIIFNSSSVEGGTFNISFPFYILDNKNRFRFYISKKQFKFSYIITFTIIL